MTAKPKEKRKCRISDDGRHVEACETLSSVTVHMKRKGIVCWPMIDMKTWKPARTFYGVKSGAHEKTGICFNFCPFCGVDISAPFASQKEPRP